MITELSNLCIHEGVLVRGIMNYGDREEARVTFFAQGRAENCADVDYYYTDTYQGVTTNTEVGTWSFLAVSY